jgi:chromosome segregation ATPase
VTNVLRSQLGGQITDLQQVVVDLTRQLAEATKENRGLARDRNRVQELLAQADLLKVQHTDAQSRWRASLQEREQLEESRRGLEAEKIELAEHCARLEHALAHERAATEAARAEIACLEEQVEQLHSIVAMLRRED